MDGFYLDGTYYGVAGGFTNELDLEDGESIVSVKYGRCGYLGVKDSVEFSQLCIKFLLYLVKDEKSWEANLSTIIPGDFRRHFLHGQRKKVWPFWHMQRRLCRVRGAVFSGCRHGRHSQPDRICHHRRRNAGPFIRTMLGWGRLTWSPMGTQIRDKIRRVQNFPTPRRVK